MSDSTIYISKVLRSGMIEVLTMWGFPLIRAECMNTIVKGTINQSDIEVMDSPAERYCKRGLKHC